MCINIKRILSLEGLRVISLIIIIISHFEFLGQLNNSFSDFYNKFLHNPTLGVDFFFLLSGFGLMMSYLKTEVDNITNKNPLRFAWSKVSKLYVLVLISFIPGIIILFIEYFSKGFTSKEVLFFCSKVAIAPTLLQSLTGISSFSHALNGVVWFLSCLTIIYFFSPFIMRFIKKYSHSNRCMLLTMIATFVIIIILSFVLNLLDGIWLFDDLSYGSPYIRVFYVILGMIIACIFLNIKDKFIGKNKLFSFLEIVLVVLGIIWFLLRNSMNQSIYILRLIDVPLVSLIILVYSFESGIISKILSLKFFIVQSKYTSYAYIIHYPIRITLVYFVSKKFELTFELACIYVATIIIGTIVLSILYAVLYNNMKKKILSYKENKLSKIDNNIK